MALFQCPECNGQLSTSAKFCPHCGMACQQAVQSIPASSRAFIAPPPGVPLATKIVVGMFFFTALCWAISDNGPLPIAGTSYAKNKKEQCKLVLQCWGNENLIGAGIYCNDSIEKLAKYSARWTTTASYEKFSRFRWFNKELGEVTFVGDKIQFQTGFGAYQAYIYECDFDPSTNTVIGVRARPGRI